MIKHYSELSSIEKKAREASGRTYCIDCPIYGLCRTKEILLDACDYIFLKAYKAGYYQHKKETKNKIKKYEKKDNKKQSRK